MSADPARRILFTGATIVTMDPELGTLQGALARRGRHHRRDRTGPECGRARWSSTPPARILAPRLRRDTHRHAWEAQLRRIMPDVDDLSAAM
ncbi:hypothetical protein ACRAWF_06150 [Streptomyces sp. L7]